MLYMLYIIGDITSLCHNCVTYINVSHEVTSHHHATYSNVWYEVVRSHNCVRSHISQSHITPYQMLRSLVAIFVLLNVNAFGL